MHCNIRPSLTKFCLFLLLSPGSALLGSDAFFQFYGNDVTIQGNLESKPSEQYTSELTLEFDIQVFASYGQSAKIPRSATLKVRETREGDLFVSQLESSRTGGVRQIGASSLIYVIGANGIDEVILIVGKGSAEIPEPDGGSVSAKNVREFIDDLLRSDVMVFRFPRSTFMSGSSTTVAAK